ncbi:ribonuclease H-like domain-containing protein [Tanacetum coccineum]
MHMIIDDYSRFTWVRFLRTKDEAPEAIIKCIKNIQVRLNATVRNVRTDNGTEFVNQTLREFYENVGISHQTSVACTPQQNDIVERRNRNLVEVLRTIYAPSKKAFRSTNQRTRKLLRQFHVTFDRATAMASNNSVQDPAYHSMTPLTSVSETRLNIVPQHLIVVPPIPKKRLLRIAVDI